MIPQPTSRSVITSTNSAIAPVAVTPPVGADGRQYVAYDSYTINGHTIDLAHDPATAKPALQPASSRPGIETTIGIQHQLDNTNGSNSVIISNDNFATSA